MAASHVRPGDLTVAPVHGGFLIGRILPERGPGPWWAYVATTSNLHDAVELARHAALIEDSNAWLHLGSEDYRLIPLDDLLADRRPHQRIGA